jgi:hypothetical protein
MNLSPIKIAYEKYEAEPTVENKLKLVELLKTLAREIQFKKMTRSELQEELKELELFYSATRALADFNGKEEQLCTIKASIKYCQYLLKEVVTI